MAAPPPTSSPTTRTSRARCWSSSATGPTTSRPPHCPAVRSASSSPTRSISRSRSSAPSSCAISPRSWKWTATSRTWPSTRTATCSSATTRAMRCCAVCTTPRCPMAPMCTCSTPSNWPGSSPGSISTPWPAPATARPARAGSTASVCSTASAARRARWASSTSRTKWSPSSVKAIASLACNWPVASASVAGCWSTAPVPAAPRWPAWPGWTFRWSRAAARCSSSTAAPRCKARCR